MTSQSSHHIPRSVIKTSRKELDLDLKIHQQKDSNSPPTLVDELPKDLQGYAFIVGALFQAEDRHQDDGTLLYTGDGMIYRLGFEEGKATLKTRIAKTPCYYADLPTQLYLAANAVKPKAQFAKEHPIFSYFSGFRDGGQSRYSIILGARNQLNTAFLRIRDRLLVTIDAGRPYEVDLDTLELLSPTGSTQDWKGIFPVIAKVIGINLFDIYINSAHPVTDISHLDNKPDEFFTTNYSTGYNGKFEDSIKLVLDGLSGWFKQFLSDRYDVDDFGRFTYLIRYQFGDRKIGLNPKMKRWKMVLPDGEPILVKQSLHQIAITEDYLLLSDITFRMEFSQIFSPFFLGFLRLAMFKNEAFYSFGSWLYSIFLKQFQPLSFSDLYIINRNDLNENAENVIAKKVTIPLEISHFAADYANPNHKITIHIGHSNGWDVTEGITHYDESVPGKPALRKDLEGMMTGTTDLGSLGQYVIDGETGKIERSKLLHDADSTWSLSVYTHRNICRDSQEEPSKTIKNIYWMSWGFSWELIPQRIYEAYKKDGHRVIPVEDLPNENKPVTLLRVDTELMEIADSYQFPSGYFACSPQFIPTQSVEGDDSNGYIVCIVLKDNPENPSQPVDEFWIFHADDFNNKPIYRLSGGKEPLNLALTLHSTWLPNIDSGRYTEEERRQIREDSIKLDYDNLLENKYSTIKTLFADIVYPHFINQTLEVDFEKAVQCSKEASH